jgi:hypothetical protein
MTSGNNWAYTWAEWDDGFYFTVGATSEWDWPNGRPQTNLRHGIWLQ